MCKWFRRSVFEALLPLPLWGRSLQICVWALHRQEAGFCVLQAHVRSTFCSCSQQRERINCGSNCHWGKNGGKFTFHILQTGESRVLTPICVKWQNEESCKIHIFYPCWPPCPPVNATKLENERRTPAFLFANPTIARSSLEEITAGNLESKCPLQSSHFITHLSIFFLCVAGSLPNSA